MKQWLKGAMHVHSAMSDSLGTPQTAVDAYYKCGYDFMFFTDHKTNFDVSQIANKYDMLVMGGVELDSGQDPFPNYDYNKEPKEDWVKKLATNTMENEFGDQTWLHINALGVNNTNIKFDIIQGQMGKTVANATDAIEKAGGVPMVCHPNWLFSPSFRELLDSKRNFLLEIGCSAESYFVGTFSKESPENIWDILLSKGRTVYAAATDDAHHYFKTEQEPWLDYDCGFVYVFAEKNEESVKEALRNGCFYASNGIKLADYSVTDKKISVKVEPEKDRKYCIMFKGKMGLPLKCVYGTEGEYSFQNIQEEEYVRVKVVSNKINSSYFSFLNYTYNEACYLQPVFLDGRKTMI